MWSPCRGTGGEEPLGRSQGEGTGGGAGAWADERSHSERQQRSMGRPSKSVHASNRDVLLQCVLLQVVVLSTHQSAYWVGGVGGQRSDGASTLSTSKWEMVETSSLHH